MGCLISPYMQHYITACCVCPLFQISRFLSVWLWKESAFQVGNTQATLCELADTLPFHAEFNQVVQV